MNRVFRKCQDILSPASFKCSWPFESVVDRTGLLASALDHIHSKGLLFQDLKAANILETKDGSEWRLTGFGSAAWIKQDDGLPTQLHTSM